ncbi:ABC transporter substrate-binding protein [soil metagenome]
MAAHQRATRRYRSRNVGLVLGAVLSLGAWTSVGAISREAGTATTDPAPASSDTTPTSDETAATTAGSGPEATAPSGTEAASGTEQVLRPPTGDVPECTYDGEARDLSDLTVGFSQSEAENNPFRIAETQSIEQTAEELGVGELLTTNANSDLATQVSDIQDLLAQGVDLLIVAPLNSEGLEPALNQAKDQGVPVITIDRELTSTPCEDFVTFIGSDFLDQGERAADQMIEATGGEATIAILVGSPGNLVTTARTDGFVQSVDELDGMEIVAQQTGNFTREGGQEVTAQLIQANPDINAIYAENDEMALGALQALRDAGKIPGEDVMIVSIDGTQEAVQAVVDGEIYAVVESNPRFGPLAFDVAQRYLNGEAIPSKLLIEDAIYTQDNAAEDIDNAY